jgi:hypothetical protein
MSSDDLTMTLIERTAKELQLKMTQAQQTMTSNERPRT